MKTISRSEIPEDYTYYRTGSKVFYEYTKKYTSNIVEKIGKGYEFFTAMRFLGGFSSISVEKQDEELTKEKLANL